MPGGSSTDDEDGEKKALLTEKQNSARGTKGFLTTLYTAARKQVEFVKSNPTAYAIKNLEEVFTEVKKHNAILREKYVELQGLDPANFDTYQAKVLEEQTRFNELAEAVIPTISEAEMAPAEDVCVAPDENQIKVRPNNSLKPPILGKNANPVDLRIWIGKFKAYFSSSHFELSTIPEKQAYLFNCLDSNIQTIYESKLSPRFKNV